MAFALEPYNNDIFSVFSFLGFVVVLIPLKWHLLSWNVGGCMYIFWTAISCLAQFTNSRLFKGTAEDVAPAWCEFSTRLMMAAQAAIPVTSLVINRRLYLVAACRRAQILRGEKTRMMLCDFAISLGVPLLQVVAYTIAQGHRYDIFEDVGCVPTVYNTPMAIVMVYMWPIVIGLISAVYCALTLRHFARRWAEVKEFLLKGDGMTFSRYFRLMGLAAADICLTVPLASWALYLNVGMSKVYPWISWADTHSGFNRVIQVPTVLWHVNRNVVLGRELTRWSPVICAIVFFGLFGFAQEARRNYILLINSVGRLTGVKLLQSFGTTSQQTHNSKAPPRYGQNSGSNTSSAGAVHAEPKGMPSESFFAHVDFAALADEKDGYSPTTTGPSSASIRGSPTEERCGPFAPTQTGSSRGSIAPSVAPGLQRERANSLESVRSAASLAISISSVRRSLDEPRHSANMV